MDVIRNLRLTTHGVSSLESQHQTSPPPRSSPPTSGYQPGREDAGMAAKSTASASMTHQDLATTHGAPSTSSQTTNVSPSGRKPQPTPTSTPPKIPRLNGHATTRPSAYLASSNMARAPTASSATPPTSAGFYWESDYIPDLICSIADGTSTTAISTPFGDGHWHYGTTIHLPRKRRAELSKITITVS